MNNNQRRKSAVRRKTKIKIDLTTLKGRMHDANLSHRYIVKRRQDRKGFIVAEKSNPKVPLQSKFSSDV